MTFSMNSKEINNKQNLRGVNYKGFFAVLKTTNSFQIFPEGNCLGTR